MTTFKHLSLEIGIYSTVATITRHQDGSVTIRNPYVNWINNSGSLAFSNIHLTGNTAKDAKDIFSDSPPVIDGYPMSYGEFISDHIN